MRTTIGNFIRKQEVDKLILAILREPVIFSKAKLSALNAVLEIGNRRRSKLARFGDAGRCCRGLADRSDLGWAVCDGARAVIAELARRDAGKTLLRAGACASVENGGGLLRAAQAGNVEPDSDLLLRALDVDRDAPEPGVPNTVA